jgi:hypothetical protein
MRTEIPAWVAIVVILVVLVIAAIFIWRGTGVQKQEFLPGQKMKELGVKMAPTRPGQPPR